MLEEQSNLGVFLKARNTEKVKPMYMNLGRNPKTKDTRSVANRSNKQGRADEFALHQLKLF